MVPVSNNRLVNNWFSPKPVDPHSENPNKVKPLSSLFARSNLKKVAIVASVCFLALAGIKIYGSGTSSVSNRTSKAPGETNEKDYFSLPTSPDDPPRNVRSDNSLPISQKMSPATNPDGPPRNVRIDNSLPISQNMSPAANEGDILNHQLLNYGGMEIYRKTGRDKYPGCKMGCWNLDPEEGQVISEHIHQWKMPNGAPFFSTPEQFMSNAFIYKKFFKYYQRLENVVYQPKIHMKDFLNEIEREGIFQSNKIGNGLVATAPNGDDVGSDLLRTSTGFLETTLFKSFNVLGDSFNDSLELCKLLEQGKKQVGSPLDFLLIKAHGGPNDIVLKSLDPEILLESHEISKISSCIKDNLKIEAPIILQACRTAGSNAGSPSFAEILSKESKRTVMAPELGVTMNDCTIKVSDTGRIFDYSCMRRNGTDKDFRIESYLEFGKTFHPNQTKQ